MIEQNDITLKQYITNCIESKDCNNFDPMIMISTNCCLIDPIKIRMNEPHILDMNGKMIKVRISFWIMLILFL